MFTDIHIYIHPYTYTTQHMTYVISLYIYPTDEGIVLF